jgi:hypothetical protein
MSTLILLAPVPLVHLNPAKTKFEEQGKVAFGSRAWEVFQKLDQLRADAPVDVYLYASGDRTTNLLEVTWRARYIGHVESRGGAHPDGMRFRPNSTSQSATDNLGHWAIFWEIDQLRKLEIEARIPLAHLSSFETGKPFKPNFIPEGPLLASHLK